MASNVVLNSGSGGSTALTKQLTHDGDTTQCQGVHQLLVTGTEDAYTGTDVAGGAGAVTAGVQRVTLASDDPAVTALQLIDNAVAGSELQVDVVAALPAGTNNIGDVDVLSVVPGTGATSLGKAEDAAHTTGDTGVMALSVRQDTAAALGGTDADYQPLITDANGRLHVNVGNTVTVASHAVTNAGTFATQVDGAALTALQLIDDTVFAEDAAHTTGDKGVQLLTVRQNTAAALSGTDGDYQPLITDTNGRLHIIGNTTEAGSQVLADDAAFTPGTTRVVMAGYEADETATDSVDEGDGGAARMTLDRKIIVTPQPHTSGGLSTMNATSSDGATALTNTAQVISAAAGQLYGYYIYNPNAAAAFVQFYNTAAASVTVGTTAPLFMLTIPSGSAANLMGAHGIAFSSAGWSWAATSTAGGNGALTTALDAVAWYK